MRKLPALLVACSVAALMTGCAAGTARTAQCEYPSGDASDVVSATGAIGKQPEVTFPTPIVTDTTQASIIEPGSGAQLTTGQPARVEVSIYNGRSGDLLQATSYGAGESIILTAGDSEIASVSKALTCASVGSRIAITASAADSHNSAPAPQLGVTETDPFIFVVDVLDAYLPRATGKTELPRSGNPSVVHAPNGAPGITVPRSGQGAADAPTELVSTPLITGDGATLAAGDQAVLHYTGVVWDTNDVFDSSWEAGDPRVFDLTEGSLIPGFLNGLVGQKVGSQVLLVIPPALAYGDTPSAGIPASSTLVFVVDILGTVN